MNEENINMHADEDISEMDVYRYRVTELERKLDDLNALVTLHREGERHFEDITKASPVGIYQTDRHTKIIYANERFSEITGWAVDKVVGTGWIEMIHPEDKELLFDKLRQIGQEPKLYFVEFRILKPDSTIAWVYCQVAPQHGDKDKVIGYVGTISDITEKKTAEEECWRSEQRYSSLTENSPDVIARLDRDLKVIFVNRRGEKVLKKKSDDIVGKNISDLGFNEARLGEWKKTLTTVLETGMALDTEVDFQVSSGANIFNIRIHPEKDEKEGVKTALVLARDITEQRRSEENYKLLFNSMNDGFAQHEIVLDESGKPFDYRFVTVNPAFENLMKLKINDVLGKTAREVIADFQEPWIEMYGRVALSGKPEHHEVYFSDQDKYFEVTAFSNRRGYFACVYHDVTERKYGEIELKIMAETLDMLNRQTGGEDVIKPILKIIKKHTGFESVAIRLKEENDYPYYDSNGFTESHLQTETSLCSKDADGNPIRDDNGKPILDCICGTVIDGRSDISQSFFTPCGSFWSNHLDEDGRDIVTGNKIERGRFRCVHQGYNSMAIIPLKSQNTIIGALQLNDHRPNRFTSQKMQFFEGIGQSIGVALAKKKAEDKIRDQATEWVTTFDVMPEMVLLLDENNFILRANKTAQMALGASEDDLRNMKCKDIFNRLDDKMKVCTTDGENPCSEEHDEEIFSERLNRHYHLNFKPVRDAEERVTRSVMVLRDITERKRHSEEMTKAQKLESLGILAGGIAHDFNNILQSLWGNITITKMDMAPTGDKYELLSEAELACRRIRDLTGQLLTFARGGAPIKQTADIRELIVETAKFSTRGSNVKIETSVPPDLWRLDVDKTQLSQVLDNLVINAVQAMPGGGTINVRAENVEVKNDEVARSLGIKQQRCVRISIQDHGVGIPEENLTRIFDPYFTTKKKGSGLGLATCHSIIQKHEGRITVQSKIGEGTTFVIHLPASEMPEPRMLAPASTAAAQAAGGKILVMDDEEAIWKVSSKMLRAIGYDSDYARDGEEAIRKYTAASKLGSPFRAVILDLTVPGGMGGRETVKRLSELDKNLKAIVSSGYSDDPVMANFKDYGFKGVISKPYQLDDLKDTLSKILTAK